MQTSTLIGVIVMAVWVTAWGARDAAAAPECPPNGQITESCELKEDRFTPITISADNVTLDCKGKVIVGPGKDKYGIGIRTKRVNGITIRDCELQDWNLGIYLDGGSGHILSDISVVDSWTGIRLQATSAVTMMPASSNGISVWLGNNEIGLYLSRAFETTIKRAVINWNKRTGIKALMSNDLAISDTHVMNNGRFVADPKIQDDAGIYLDREVDDVRLSNMRFDFNGREEGQCKLRCHVVTHHGFRAWSEAGLIEFNPSPNCVHRHNTTFNCDR